MYNQPPPSNMYIQPPPANVYYQPPPIIPTPIGVNLSLPPPQLFLLPPPSIIERELNGDLKRISRWDRTPPSKKRYSSPVRNAPYASKLDNSESRYSMGESSRYSVDRKQGSEDRLGKRSPRSVRRDREYEDKVRRSRSRSRSKRLRRERKSRSLSPKRKRLRYTSPVASRPSTSSASRSSLKPRRSPSLERKRSAISPTSTPLVSRSSAPRRSAVAKPTRRTSSLRASIPEQSPELKEILFRWRQGYCHTEDDIRAKIMEIMKKRKRAKAEKEANETGNGDVAKDTDDEDEEAHVWTRSTPADLHYSKKMITARSGVLTAGSEVTMALCEHFKNALVLRAEAANNTKPTYDPPPRKNRARVCKHKTEQGSSSDSSAEEQVTDEEDCTMEELTRKQQHPDRLHPEMWYNDPGEMNDGPLCRCSKKSRKSGIRHGIYPGEQFLQICDKNTNNADTLHHYRITITPPTNFLIKTPTIIHHDEHAFIFEGFSMFSHKPLLELPTCKVIRFNIEYTILYVEETVPENFTIRELDLFHDYLFRELLELVDLDFKAFGDDAGCSQFHFMPRFVREIKPNGKEILSMNVILEYLIKSSVPLIKEDQLEDMVGMEQNDWQAYADEMKGMVVTFPGKKPCSVRVDQLDRNIDLQVEGCYKYPEIVHFGIRPPQLSYAGNPEYQKAWRDYVKFRHLLANMSKPTYDDKRRLEAKEAKLQEMRTQSKMKRDVTIAVSAEGFYRTGIMCDVIQHAMLIPVLVCHLRFHNALDVLETELSYKFRNRALLQLALTHPSYRENFGTNPDHARNSLTNCGIRQPEYGDRRIHYMNTRKRGINTLINIMSRFGSTSETESLITHNERLEFLGDAVVEFVSSVHLFHIFPDLEEGGLATYRAAIVQNQHLAVLAKVLRLDRYMLYAHGSDLCHDLELRHAMANCFEALMGALFLDGGIKVVDDVFSRTLFSDCNSCLEVWVEYPPHPLQEQEPKGDRHWIDKFDLLKKLTEFEETVGLPFNHIRLLARAFTDRSVGYTNLTLGSNQRLEFLGDTVLQLIASEYLYKFFPEHHEGHLSLLRSSLVNNRTQAVVCDDLGMSAYAVYNNPKAELKTKDRADLLEAFIGALFVDRGLIYCQGFCEVTLFPRLQDFIMNQDWNDPKSKLQQCCLTLRTMDGGEPDIPVYKVIECKGPTNTRIYTVAVYFRSKRLASAMGHSIQQAEMNAAKEALNRAHGLFPQLDHQKRVIAKSMKLQQPSNGNDVSQPSASRASNNEDEDKSSRNHSPSRHSIRSDRNSRHHRGDSRDKRSHSVHRKDHHRSSQSQEIDRRKSSHKHREHRSKRDGEGETRQRDSRSSQQRITVRSTPQKEDRSCTNVNPPELASEKIETPTKSFKRKDTRPGRRSLQRDSRSSSGQRDASYSSITEGTALKDYRSCTNEPPESPRDSEMEASTKSSRRKNTRPGRRSLRRDSRSSSRQRDGSQSPTIQATPEKDYRVCTNVNHSPESAEDREKIEAPRKSSRRKDTRPGRRSSRRDSRSSSGQRDASHSPTIQATPEKVYRVCTNVNPLESASEKIETLTKSSKRKDTRHDRKKSRRDVRSSSRQRDASHSPTALVTPEKDYRSCTNINPLESPRDSRKIEASTKSSRRKDTRHGRRSSRRDSRSLSRQRDASHSKTIQATPERDYSFCTNVNPLESPRDSRKIDGSTKSSRRKDTRSDKRSSRRDSQSSSHQKDSSHSSSYQRNTSRDISHQRDSVSRQDDKRESAKLASKQRDCHSKGNDSYTRPNRELPHPFNISPKSPKMYSRYRFASPSKSKQGRSSSSSSCDSA